MHHLPSASTLPQPASLHAADDVLQKREYVIAPRRAAAAPGDCASRLR
jgi:hypothetical protein